MDSKYRRDNKAMSKVAGRGLRYRQQRFTTTLGVRAVTLLALIAIACPYTVSAQSKQNQKPEELANLTLDELMNLQVTSVSKHEQNILSAPAAIYVLTAEDIRRSGATSIAEALRMVPGVQVAKIGASNWAISARGQNSEFANKLLVLIDGRSVYTPLFAGVVWAIQDLMLEDVERIEVIRGPGASLWGTNAVNGVINIITRNARDTQGGLIVAGAGNKERGFGAVRYGGTIGSGAYYRVYAKYFDRDHSVDQRVISEGDGWSALRGGARVDWSVSTRDSLTIQGDIYGSDLDQRLPHTLTVPPFSQTFDEQERRSGGNILARWDRLLSPESALRLQVYYDRTHMSETLLREDRNTFDVEFQHSFSANKRNQIVWGAGLRSSADKTSSSFTVMIDPATRTSNLFNAFIQDEVVLIQNKLRLTLGSKLEHNPYIGFELQPSVRIAWTAAKNHFLWGAISHSDRSPSRAERDMRVNIAVVPDQTGSLTYFSLFGNRDLTAEDLDAYEAGYRFQPTQRLWFRIATFYNIYEQLNQTLPGTSFIESTPAPVHLVIPFRIASSGEAHTTGVEGAFDWIVASQWKLAGGYSWYEKRKGTTVTGFMPGDTPRNQFHIRSLLNLTSNLECDVALYYVDKLPALAVPRYLRADVRFGWRPSDSIELSLTGQNLFDKRHSEFGPSLFGFGSPRSVVERTVLGKLTWHF